MSNCPNCPTSTIRYDRSGPTQGLSIVCIPKADYLKIVSELRDQIKKISTRSWCLENVHYFEVDVIKLNGIGIKSMAKYGFEFIST